MSADQLHTRPFSTVLVANRGEIACRVIRSARASGYRTIAVYSDADADAPHVAAADMAVHIGPAAASASYLDTAKILDAATRSGADAIHPGYGFLSENADFASACHAAGIVFIGPPPPAIELMGDKAAAKRRAKEAGVPLLPGYEGQAQDDATLIAKANDVGFPLMVKAAAGGGGKGMRLVDSPAALPDAIAGARREARSAFGDDTLLIERALIRPRHVEIQVLADAHGNVIALGERDCSVQRRHQKVVEESPAPGLSDETRQAMQDAAISAARDIGYVGAGTVEFLLDTRDSTTFSFLEMNTRLQVEHPVTEMVTGVDLVDAQLRVAAGEQLWLTQDDVTMSGHAIEVRLYAEDPSNNYLPQTGEIVEWSPPSGPGVRVDDGIRTGGRVTADYDPMLAKVIAHGRDRGQAVRRLRRAMEDTVLLGVRTNRSFLVALLSHPAFAGDVVTTAFLSEHDVAAPAVSAQDLALVAARLHLHDVDTAEQRSPGFGGWSNSQPLELTQHLRIADQHARVRINRRGQGLEVAVGPLGATDEPPVDEPEQDTIHLVTGGPERLSVDGVSRPAHIRLERMVGQHRALVSTPTLDFAVADTIMSPPEEEGAGGAGVLVAPMHGAVVAVSAGVSDVVTKGQPVLVMEAMKMEHVITADIDGTIEEIVAVGSQVADGDVVVRITPADEPAAE